MSPTVGSPLLNLPTELQLKIYAYYFRPLTQIYPYLEVPSLLTSRSISSAAQTLWFKNTTFDLKNTVNLLDYLTALSAPQIKQLRHLSLRAVPFPIYLDEPLHRVRTYGFDQVLALFPDLQLDTLTLIDAFHGPLVSDCQALSRHAATYGEVQSLVEQGCGWRKLLYRSESAVWIQRAQSKYRGNAKSAHIHKTVTQAQQHGNWDRLIKQRDGPDSGAGVRVWVKEADIWAELPPGHEKLDIGRDMLPWYNGNDELAKSMYGEGDASPKVEIQITRGRNADILDKGAPLIEHSKALHAWWGRMSWKEMKESRYLGGDGLAQRNPTSLM